MRQPSCFVLGIIIVALMLVGNVPAQTGPTSTGQQSAANPHGAVVAASTRPAQASAGDPAAIEEDVLPSHRDPPCRSWA